MSFQSRRTRQSFSFAFVLLASASACLVNARNASAQSLPDALNAAWARGIPGQTSSARSAELAARGEAADRWLAEPPAVSLSQRTDKLNRNQGSREYEVELSLPLRPPGARSRDQSVAGAERSAFDRALVNAKLNVAGEVREAYWQVRLTAIDRAAAQERLASATAFAVDVGRRVQAGELARIDKNRAESERDAAEYALAEAELKASLAAQAFTQLTGLAVGNTIAERGRAATFRVEDHPAYVAQRAVIDVAKSKADYAANVRRDPVELTVASVRERGDFAEPYNSSARVGIRIPLPSASRSAPLIAEANAARVEAEAALQLVKSRLAAEYEAARHAHERWTAMVAIAERRAALALDTATLTDKSFRLGETDLPARLRAEADRLDAARGAERAKAELSRATSQLNQSLGLLP
jgi:outer membrane protein, heavy metal efflux system